MPIFKENEQIELDNSRECILFHLKQVINLLLTIENKG